MKRYNLPCIPSSSILSHSKTSIKFILSFFGMVAKNFENKLMTQFWYQCTKCGIAVKNDSPPSAARCLKGATHNWHQLGKVGTTTYTCGKCETTIKTDSIPDSDGCLSGGLHSWYKL